MGGIWIIPCIHSQMRFRIGLTVTKMNFKINRSIPSYIAFKIVLHTFDSSWIPPLPAIIFIIKLRFDFVDFPPPYPIPKSPPLDYLVALMQGPPELGGCLASIILSFFWRLDRVGHYHLDTMLCMGSNIYNSVTDVEDWDDPYQQVTFAAGHRA